MQLLEVVGRLDVSQREVVATHHQKVAAFNRGLSNSLESLALTHEQKLAVLDELDEVARAYSTFTKQQMALNHEIKEQVRAIAEVLLGR